jgi:hypothetical protein
MTRAFQEKLLFDDACTVFPAPLMGGITPLVKRD